MRAVIRLNRNTWSRLLAVREVLGRAWRVVCMGILFLVVRHWLILGRTSLATLGDSILATLVAFVVSAALAGSAYLVWLAIRWVFTGKDYLS